LTARRSTSTREFDQSICSEELIATVDVSLLTLAKALWASGYRWNPLATAKYIVIDGERHWAALSVAYREAPDADTQHHLYLVRGPDGRWQVRGHKEANVTRPDEHDGGDELVPGDPDGRVPTALGEAGLV